VDITEQIKITNRFQPLPTVDSDKMYPENNPTNQNNDHDISHKLPLIYIYGVTNYKEIVQNLSLATEKGTYITIPNDMASHP
jgi:hypothetical protein